MTHDPPVILIIDDNLTLPGMLAYTLQREGFRVLIALDTDLAVRLATTEHPNLVILDLQSLGAELDMYQHVRQMLAAPILIVRTEHGSAPTIGGVDLGAADYLAQPYRLWDIVTRVRAALSGREIQDGLPTDLGQVQDDRAGRQPLTLPALPAPSLVVGPLVVDMAARRVTCAGHGVTLKPKEFELLAVLARHPDQVFSREQLLMYVWSAGFTGGVRTVDVHIRYLRTKIEVDPDHPQLLQTAYSRGYKLVSPDPTVPLVPPSTLGAQNTGPA